MPSLVDSASRWSAAGFALRLATLGATGIAWTVVSLHSVGFHPNFWDPSTLSDWFAIWAYSAAWLLTAASLLVFRQVAAGDDALRAAAVVVAVTSAATGIANALEDGFEVSGMGAVYVTGILSSFFGMLILAAMTRSSAIRPLAFVPLFGALAAFGMVLGGGFLALIAWPGLGVALVRARRAPSPEARTAT